MKNIFVFYVKTNKNTNFSPVYNKKKLLTEKDCKLNFYSYCINRLQDIKNQTPRTFENSYFIFLPSDCSHLNEIIKFDNSKEYVLINIERLTKNKFFKENFRSFLKEINGEKIFEDIDLLICDSMESFDENEELNQDFFTFYKYEIFKK